MALGWARATRARASSFLKSSIMVVPTERFAMLMMVLVVKGSKASADWMAVLESFRSFTRTSPPTPYSCWRDHGKWHVHQWEFWKLIETRRDPSSIQHSQLQVLPLLKTCVQMISNSTWILLTSRVVISAASISSWFSPMVPIRNKSKLLLEWQRQCRNPCLHYRQSGMLPDPPHAWTTFPYHAEWSWIMLAKMSVTEIVNWCMKEGGIHQ